MIGKTAHQRKNTILLVGPPGVGKTSVARAIAQDLGWNVIELNASDARNAAAIRKAATQGSTHRSLFHDPNAKKQRTLIHFGRSRPYFWGPKGGESGPHRKSNAGRRRCRTNHYLEW